MVMEVVISLMLLFLGIAVLVSIHVCIVGRAFQRRNEERRQGGGSGESRNGIVGKRMCSDDLKNLPCFEYKEAEKGGGNHVDCAICLQSFKAGDMCRFLPNCSHSFHVPCIDLWILKTPICPICRSWVHSPVAPTVPTQQVDVSDNVGIEIV